jgi:hypothetical protein
MRSALRSHFQPAVVSATVALLLAGLLYSDVLSLPLFSDDLVQIPWLESVSWRELWTRPSPYGYYRPLWYTIWRMWGRVTGGLHPLGLHLLNLIAHVVATWLTGMMAVPWLRPAAGRAEQAVAAGLAAAFFVVFPFSRQAVAWPGAVYNPLVSGMAAAAVLSYDRGRRRRRDAWVGAAFLLAALGAFTYESGMLVAPLLVTIELFGRLRGRWRTRSWWPLAFAGFFLISLTLWRSMRGMGVVGFGVTGVDLWHNLAYLAQGLVFPVAPLAERLVSGLMIDPVLAVWCVALPVAALLAWQAMRRSPDAFLLGVGWFGLFAIPPLVSMEAEWFALAPRFLYMTAAGVSLIWSAALSTWIAAQRWRNLVLIGLTLGVLLTPAGVFVRRGIRLYHMVGEGIWAATAAAARERSVLLVNLPRRITPNERMYPLGFEGVTPLPMRVTADGLAYVHTGVRDAAEAVAFGVVATDQPAGYRYQLFGPLVGWKEAADAARRVRGVYLTRYESESIRLLEAGGLEESAASVAPLAQFGDHLALLEGSSTCDAGGHVHLTTRWLSQSDIDIDASVFAHLLQADGTLVAQADGHALLGMLPFWMWKPGETVRDVRHFDAVPGGEYVTRVGVWEPASGKRWQAAGYRDGVVSFDVRCP